MFIIKTCYITTALNYKTKNTAEKAQKLCYNFNFKLCRNLSQIIRCVWICEGNQRRAVNYHQNLLLVTCYSPASYAATCCAVLLPVTLPHAEAFSCQLLCHVLRRSLASYAVTRSSVILPVTLSRAVTENVTSLAMLSRSLTFTKSPDN